jgi:hypothetical protein
VRADGIDDGYATAGNVDFSGTDKVTVFAALRKLSDANQSVFVELGGSVGAAGSFGMFAPGAAGAPRLDFFNNGGTLRNAFANNAIYAAGLNHVVTCEGDIAASLTRIRVNAVNVSTNTSSLGGGTYLNAALNLLARNNGSSTFFNGNLYALIVAGGSYPLSTIQRVERLLSRITPTVNL